jgi:hypothetical protein
VGEFLMIQSALRQARDGQTWRWGAAGRRH